MYKVDPHTGEPPVIVADVEHVKLVDVGHGDMVMEELLNIDKAPDGLALAPCVHYNEGRVLNQTPIDQIMVSTECKGLRRSYAPKVFQKTAMINVKTLMNGMKPKVRQHSLHVLLLRSLRGSIMDVKTRKDQMKPKARLWLHHACVSGLRTTRHLYVARLF